MHCRQRRIKNSVFSLVWSFFQFYVYNDIFRYQDEVFNDLEDNTSGGNDNATTFEGVKKVENVEAVENEKNFANDGIATVSIIDGVQKEPHLNGGGSSGLVFGKTHLLKIQPLLTLRNTLKAITK